MKKMIHSGSTWQLQIAAGAFVFSLFLTGCQLVEGDLFDNQDTETHTGAEIDNNSDNVVSNDDIAVCPDGSITADGSCADEVSSDGMVWDTEAMDTGMTVDSDVADTDEGNTVADSDVNASLGTCSVVEMSLKTACENGFHHIIFMCQDGSYYEKGSDDVCLSALELIDIATNVCGHMSEDGTCASASIDSDSALETIDSEDTDASVDSDTANQADTDEAHGTDLFELINPSDSTGLAEIGSDGLSGIMSRYWDCCKPSCAWDTAMYTSPALACTQDNSYFAGAEDAQSACSGGDAYACWSLSPWQVNTRLAYGFARSTGAAATEAGGLDCGECIQIEFDGDLEGKTMVVQIVETGVDIGDVSIQLMVPGGGVEVFNACATQWGTSNLGAQYGGFLTECISTHTTPMEALDCLNVMCRSAFDGKEDLKNGCLWFLKWLYAQDMPDIKWQKIECPAALTNVSGMH